ncbi:2,3-diaminopropionate biosynthesis protein SbnA [Chitiniphilus purpureus]|uniref:2,3-diaminopropionate biosynthesis protein SbnA n=1 Tax=Chitiniphilus purpureus TaxID=2981137 RepID=A0ABY6DRV3_9NEIS|nr:2,3-diaminopropionate biosynthesis protein SbnA [Chitiniphilus sp. CD1]UXY15816.1 2,3-diaminopropionate biosynthesis protein SbnA [Chitiniphilus sp. CD1]
MIFDRADEIILDDVFLHLPGFLEHSNVFLKLESYNPAGSIKLKTARALIDLAEETTDLRANKRIIESSSGNIGVAISMISAVRGYNFTCVVDKNTLISNINLIKAYGAEVVVVDNMDANGGYLGSRLKYVKEQLAQDKKLVWLDQYSNQANPTAHYVSTARSIAREFPDIDFLFVGAGTTGTLAGCARYFRDYIPQAKVVAVDSEGSVNFGKLPCKRFIPGLGSSQPPKFLEGLDITEAVHVPELDSISMSRFIAHKYGLLIGGSTGTVLAALKKYEQQIQAGSCVVAISPDSGERYVDTIYNNEWCLHNFKR